MTSSPPQSLFDAHAWAVLDGFPGRAGPCRPADEDRAPARRREEPAPPAWMRATAVSGFASATKATQGSSRRGTVGLRF